MWYPTEAELEQMNAEHFRDAIKKRLENDKEMHILLQDGTFINLENRGAYNECTVTTESGFYASFVFTHSRVVGREFYPTLWFFDGDRSVFAFEPKTIRATS